MRKVLLSMAAVLALSLTTANAQSVCTAEDGQDGDGNDVCNYTCCNDILAVNPADPPTTPPEPGVPEDPTAALCGAVLVEGAALVAGFVDPNGQPPSDPADPTTQTIIEGCIGIAGAASTADAAGEGSCEEQAVAACVNGGCFNTRTEPGACPTGDGGGAPGLPEIPGAPELPAPPV